MEYYASVRQNEEVICVVVVESLSHIWLFEMPMDCSLPGSSVQGILQARILEWVAISSSRGSSWPRDWTWVSCIADGFFTIWTTREAPLLTMLASWAEEMWKCNSALKIIEKWLNISIMVNFACLSFFVTVWVPWSRFYFVRAASTHLVCCIRVWTDHALLHFTKYGAASLVRLWAAMISDISEAWETWCGYNGMDHMDKLKRFGDFSI